MTKPSLSGTGGVREVNAAIRSCHLCRRPVVWMRTYFGGRAMPFEADPIPRILDDGTGWIPGQFRVGTRMSTVFAPLRLFPPERRRDCAQVLALHVCPNRAA